MIQFKENRSAVAIVGLLIATISIVVGGLLAFTDMLIFHFDQRFMKTVYSLWLIGSTLGMTLFLLSTNLRPGKYVPVILSLWLLSLSALSILYNIFQVNNSILDVIVMISIVVLYIASYRIIARK